MIAEAMTSLKAAGEILKSLYEAKLDADTKKKIGELKDLVVIARDAAFDAQDELSKVKRIACELEQKVLELEAWGQERERYKLFKPDALHSVTYGLKESDSNGEPAHYLCANCYQKRRKSILNNHKNKEGWTAFLCPECGASIPTQYRGQVLPEFISD